MSNCEANNMLKSRALVTSDLIGNAVELPGLHSLAQEFCDQLARSFLDLAGLSVSIQAGEELQYTNDDELKSIFEKCRSFVLISSKDAEQAYLAVSASIWGWLVNRCFGGADPSQNNDHAGPLSVVEIRFSKHVATAVANSLEQSLIKYDGSRIVSSKYVEDVQIKDKNGKMICLECTVSKDHEQIGQIYLTLPNRLIKRNWLKFKKDHDLFVKPDMLQTEDFQKCVSSTNVAISAVIVKDSIPLSTLIALEVGQFLELMPADNCQTKLLVSNTQVWSGQLAKRANQYQITITS